MTFAPEQLDRSKADLARLLRDLRKRAGLSGDRLARRCGLSQSTISKIETGRKIPRPTEVESILRALGVAPGAAEEIMSLARVANTEWQGVRASLRRGLEKRQTELSALEASATVFRYFLPAMVTGLLATPEYVRAGLAHSPGDTASVVARKLERQAVLYDTAKSFTFLLTEQAVRWAVVPPMAMSVQVERLVALSRLPNVRIGIVPNGVVAGRGPMNTFTVYGEHLATVETFTGRIVFRDSRDISEHLAIFALYEGMAMFDTSSETFLSAVAADFRSKV
ncbi:helix-turn-helix transcriptional regulator [Streptomyces sp. NRRL S-495]|uniref:helix-turn-helix domain-containing protein n=1 Tax=Streptomyces sp. NRRL S-495 TaxID=1609133 RepID=UPI0005F8F8E6|nr:helix-turn-helix transcriptional regulator [Streptomyces sp. NRRL S-495]KJY40155.1 regulatory protein [Streptomyces sp. NRRL S-495]